MKRLIALLAGLLVAFNALAWGQKGHDVVAYIAEQHLTPAAAAAIDKLLDGHSPVYYANWLDNASHTPAYAYTKTWHYLNIDEGETLDSMPKNPKGDILTAITTLVEEIRAGKLSPEEEGIRLRMLIHLVGDLHCPMHAGRLSDLGGNRCVVLFFDKATNLHAVWDSDLVEASHRWSYTEWQQQIDRASEEEIAAIQCGTPRDWLLQTHALCTPIYDRTPAGTKISYDYIAAATPTIEQQLLRGGLRLARLLNTLYDPER